MKPNLFISFSGGRTSAFMTWWLLNNARDYFADVVVIFANTGAEHPLTLDFVNECDKRWSLGVRWVEAVVHHGVRKSSTHKIVTYESASRTPAPFEEVIKKYGIPNKSFPHCTRELKVRPMESYVANELGWKAGTFLTAIGLRADEGDRINENAEQLGLIYPLIRNRRYPSIDTYRRDVTRWWKLQPFDLGLDDKHGNCVWCWKKSLKKLTELIAEDPAQFAFPRRMEEEHAWTGPRKDGKPRVFFRERRSTLDLEVIARNATLGLFEEDFEESGGCSESCDIHSA